MHTCKSPLPSVSVSQKVCLAAAADSRSFSCSQLSSGAARGAQAHSAFLYNNKFFYLSINNLFTNNHDPLFILSKQRQKRSRFINYVLSRLLLLVEIKTTEYKLRWASPFSWRNGQHGAAQRSTAQHSTTQHSTRHLWKVPQGPDCPTCMSLVVLHSVVASCVVLQNLWLMFVA